MNKENGLRTYWRFVLAITLLVCWTLRNIYSNDGFLMVERSRLYSFKTKDLFEPHRIRGNDDDRLAYILDPSSRRLVERDATSKDYRASCYDFSGTAINNTNNEYVRCTPSFSIAGMPKSGTSALHYYLRHHPDLMLMDKEKCVLDGPRFYERNIGGGLISSSNSSLSQSYFELLPPIQNVCKDCLVGEACVEMGLRDVAAYKSAMPSLAAIFLLLRHPAKQIYASYWFWCTVEEIQEKVPGCLPGQDNWNPQKNISYVNANGLVEWYDFPRYVSRTAFEGGNDEGGEKKGSEFDQKDMKTERKRWFEGYKKWGMEIQITKQEISRRCIEEQMVHQDDRGGYVDGVRREKEIEIRCTRSSCAVMHSFSASSIVASLSVR